MQASCLGLWLQGRCPRYVRAQAIIPMSIEQPVCHTLPIVAEQFFAHLTALWDAVQERISIGVPVLGWAVVVQPNQDETEVSQVGRELTQGALRYYAR